MMPKQNYEETEVSPPPSTLDAEKNLDAPDAPNAPPPPSAYPPVPSLHWHFTKDSGEDSLEEAYTKTAAYKKTIPEKGKPPPIILPYVLARDLTIDKSNKQYARFETHADLVAYLRAATARVADAFAARAPLPPFSPHLNEIIYARRAPPVAVYFDIDRALHPENDGAILADPYAHLAAVLRLFERHFPIFLHQNYRDDPEDPDAAIPAFVLGTHYHAAECITPTKFSCHIKVNLRCPDINTHANLALAWERYLAQLPTEERTVLSHYEKGELKSDFDASVYSAFRSFRTLYSSKYKSTGAQPLLPYGASSRDVADHMVVWHPERMDHLPEGQACVAGVTIRGPMPVPEPPPPSLPADGGNRSCNRNRNGRDAAAPRGHVVVSTYRVPAPADDASSSHPHHASAAYTMDAIPPQHAVHLAEAIQMLSHLPALRQLLQSDDADASNASADAPLEPPIVFRRPYPTPDPDIFTLPIADPLPPSTAQVPTAPRRRYRCPIAGRVHASNHMYLTYHVGTRAANLKCHDQECHDAWKNKPGTLRHVFHVYAEEDLDARRAELEPPRDTLHCMEDRLRWDVQYDAPSMQPYPLAPLVAIRGNMGSAKTKTLLENFLTEHASAPTTSVLVITYSRMLANAYDRALKSKGFVNYLATESGSKITAPKVIVCLDSLLRVRRPGDIPAFDYLILDEALSVLLHFNSPLMKQVQTVAPYFESVLQLAQRIYLLDACVDNSLVHAMVQYVRGARGVAPTWIWNTHVRPSNRRATLHVNRERTREQPQALQAAAVQRVVELLKQDKKVVVSCSTRGFTELLEAELLHVFKDTKKIKVYNANTDRATVQADAEDTDAAWSACDALVYSPTISAGVSFEQPFFHHLVAYCENSQYAPSVDTVLQQFFRVRCLIDGHMDIYVNDTVKVNPDHYPLSFSEVADWMDAHVLDMREYFPQGTLSFESPLETPAAAAWTPRLRYDRNRLSHAILVGILQNKNRSLLRFTNILTNTLVSDYGIPCRTVRFGESGDLVTRAQWMQQQLQLLRAQRSIPFADIPKLTLEEFTMLDLRRRDGAADLTDADKMAYWLFKAAETLWQVPLSRVDLAFFEDFIGQFQSDNKRKVFDRHFRLLRLREVRDAWLLSSREDFPADDPDAPTLCARTLKMYKGRMQARMDTLMVTGAVQARKRNLHSDFNMELFRQQHKTYTQKLIEGQKVLVAVLGEAGTLQLMRALGKEAPPEEPLRVPTTESMQRVKEEYLQEMTEEAYARVVDMFGMQRHFSKKEDVMAKEERKRGMFVKALLEDAFNMDVESLRDSSHRQKANEKMIRTREWWKLAAYGAGCLRVLEEDVPYMFLEDLDTT
jgi:hypothetical protein